MSGLGGELGVFNGIPMYTDHRIEKNTWVAYPPDWSLATIFGDRSMVREDCDCNYCKWEA